MMPGRRRRLIATSRRRVGGHHQGGAPSGRRQYCCAGDQGRARDLQFAGGDWQLEATWAGTARINMNNPFHMVDARTVRMTRNDRMDRPPVRCAIEVPSLVHEHERDLFDLDPCRHRQYLRPIAAVVVATYGGERRQCGQRSENCRIADIPRVKNVIAPA